jgi:hypothetical protein
MNQPDLLHCARTIDAELPDLLPGPGDAPVRARLHGLVARLAAGEPVDDELFEALTDHEAVRRRLDELLPAEQDKGGPGSGFQELPGHGEPVDAVYFVCPHGDYRYPVLEVGEYVPPCPAHHLALVAEC